MIRQMLLGSAAGAAGTTALNAATYIDMAVRGRRSSSTPEQTVERLSEIVGVGVPGDEETRGNRVTGLGALTGVAGGLAAGVAYALVRAAGWRPGAVGGTITAATLAMLAGTGPMMALGVTDPRTWPAAGWAADIGPHLAYGAVTAAVLSVLDPR